MQTAFGSYEQDSACRPRRSRRRLWSRESSLPFYAFASPWIIGFLLLTLAPMIYAMAVSFTDYQGMGGHWHWIGIQNYLDMVNDPQTWASLWLTFKFMLIWIPLNLGSALGLAVLVNRRLPGIGIFRTIFYIPAVVAIVAGALAWKLMFDTSVGVINWAITRLGGPAIIWLADPTVFFTVIVLMVWSGAGYSMVIILAGLQGVPPELREAAAIDGANAAQSFRYITLPLLSPALLYLLILHVLWALQTVVQPLLMTSNSGVLGMASSSAAARLKGRGKNALFGLVLATMMIPALVYVIPTYLMFSHIPGLIGSFYPWLFWGLAGSPMFIFLYRQFFRGIPTELEDAAIVDGCGLFRIFAQIFLPLSKPVVATVAILSFQGQWGDFFTQSIFLNSGNYTLAAQLPIGYLVPGSSGGQPQFNLMAAGNLVFILPVMVVFFIGQRYFVQGVVTTGLKG